MYIVCLYLHSKLFLHRIIYQVFLSNTNNLKIDLFDSEMGPQQVLPLWVRVDLGVMSIKWYSALTISLELEPYLQILFSIILRTPLFVGWRYSVF